MGRSSTNRSLPLAVLNRRPSPDHTVTGRRSRRPEGRIVAPLFLRGQLRGRENLKLSVADAKIADRPRCGFGEVRSLFAVYASEADSERHAPDEVPIDGPGSSVIFGAVLVNDGPGGNAELDGFVIHVSNDRSGESAVGVSEQREV